MVNPNITLAPGGQLMVLPDPNPKKHPNTDVLEITAAIATDTTFTAPGVTGCGPGGAKNIPVDEALDAGAGLPAASGVNSLTLNGSFAIADCFNTKNQANILLSAFSDSSTTAGTRASARRIPFSQLHSVLRHLGMQQPVTAARNPTAVIEGAPPRRCSLEHVRRRSARPVREPGLSVMSCSAAGTSAWPRADAIPRKDGEAAPVVAEVAEWIVVVTSAATRVAYRALPRSG